MKLVAKLIVIVAVFFGGFFVGKNLNNSASLIQNANTQVAPQEISVNIMLDEGDATIKTFTNIKVAATSTAFDVLKKITDENKLELTYKDYGGDMGVLVESIDHKTGDTKTNMFWQYWVNDALAQVGASKYQLKNNDVIEWKYIKDQFFN